LPVVPICRTDAALPPKNLTCAVGQITSISFGRPALLKEGRFAVVMNVGRGMRWMFSARQDEARGKRTAKSCGPDTPTLVSSGAKQVSRGDGGNKARFTRESTKETVKTNRAGKAGCSGRTCGDLLMCFFILRMRLRVRLRIRLSLRPLPMGANSRKTRAFGAARSLTHVFSPFEKSHAGVLLP
jgi:hypothetical protein